MSGPEARLDSRGAGRDIPGGAGDGASGSACAPRAPGTPSGSGAPGGAGSRREGPTDLRLVPPALAVWTAAASTLGLPGRWVAAVAVACLVPAVVLLVAASRTSREGRSAGRSRGVAAGGAVLLCAATGAAVAGLHGADVRRGPVPGLAEEYARIDADVRVTSDPRTTRPAVRGNHSAPALLLIDAEVMEVRTPNGTGTRVRTPVLLMVAAGDHRADWQKLLPSTRLRLGGRLSPPAHEGERLAAVLRVDDEGAPRITGPPTWIQRAAGELRAGLREATDDLDADARALLPGLVVGDTSRVPSDLHEAFKATDLTHLLSVSGANLREGGGWHREIIAAQKAAVLLRAQLADQVEGVVESSAQPLDHEDQARLAECRQVRGSRLVEVLAREVPAGPLAGGERDRVGGHSWSPRGSRILLRSKPELITGSFVFQGVRASITRTYERMTTGFRFLGLYSI